MLKFPSALQAQFEKALRQKAVAQNALSSPEKIPLIPFTKGGTQGRKYRFSETDKVSLAHFLRKLDDKRQSKE
jgi:hypothetical protein